MCLAACTMGVSSDLVMALGFKLNCSPIRYKLILWASGTKRLVDTAPNLEQFEKIKLPS